MPTENTGSTEETSGQEQQQDQQQATTPETGATDEQQQSGTSTPTPEQPVKLPEDHPLVKSLAAQKASLASQKAEITELRAKSAQVTKLEDELKARPSKEAVETLQTRYDRLEEFLQAAGGPLGKALDSRSFTKALFESDENITDLVKKWHAANPSATTTALGSKGSAPDGKKVDVSALLRAAAK